MSSGVSEWMSERTNERSGARERSEQCGANEWVSGASERASGRANGPALYASISYHFKPLCYDPILGLSKPLWARSLLSFSSFSFPPFPLYLFSFFLCLCSAIILAGVPPIGINLSSSTFSYFGFLLFLLSYFLSFSFASFFLLFFFFWPILRALRFPWCSTDFWSDAQFFTNITMHSW